MPENDCALNMFLGHAVQFAQLNATVRCATICRLQCTVSLFGGPRALFKTRTQYLTDSTDSMSMLTGTKAIVTGTPFDPISH
jgi:hypothetical protein